MFKNAEAFSSFSVDNLAIARRFYKDVVELDIEDNGEMGFALKLAGGGMAFVYPKPHHQPASFTVLNFVVDDIEQVFDELVARGIQFEHYQGLGQNAKGIAWGKPGGSEPSIAWFKDPAGNIISILQQQN